MRKKAPTTVTVTVTEESNKLLRLGFEARNADHKIRLEFKEGNLMLGKRKQMEMEKKV